MDEFLLIVTSDWIELENAATAFAGFADIPTIQDLVTNMDWNALSQFMEDASIIPNGAQISNARMINTGALQTDFRFWYRM